jgi:hypothetical protein
MAALAVRGYLGPTIYASDFTGNHLHTRDQFAEILYASFVDDLIVGRVAKDPITAPLAYEAVRFLRPELLARNVDYDELIAKLHTKSFGATGTLQPEVRIKQDGDTPSGTRLIYRGVVGGEVARNISLVVSASNWAQDARRPFYNDYGSQGFNAFNEAYLRYDGANGLDIRVGRMSEHWGPGMRGATLVSDNVPPFDELRVAFPFSLGRIFGKNWHYTQFASTFNDYGGRSYFEGRRVEYAFSNHWNFQFEEAFKANYSGSLAATPVPFLIFKSFDLDTIDTKYNYNTNLGLSYTANPNTRVYGQLFGDDFKSPLGGHKLFGLSLGNKISDTPRRIGYLIGGTHQAGGTAFTLEYAFADPTSNIFKNDNATWERGRADYIGMPNGPNTTELSGRIAQKYGPNLTVAAEYRDRQRHDNSFPAPTSRYFSLSGDYKLSHRETVGATLHEYWQDPFPFQPGDPGYPPPQKYMPFSQANPGTKMRTHEVDLTYKVTF